MTSADARCGMTGGEKPSVVLLSRPSAIDPARKITYELVDQPPSKASCRWERVAAVICQGKRWQFKEYPFKVWQPSAGKSSQWLLWYAWSISCYAGCREW